MFSRQINADTQLRLSIPRYAEAIFELTDRNRAFLRQWLPWVDSVTRPADTRTFIADQLLRFHKGSALHATIFYKGQAAGVVSYNRIDSVNFVGDIGYWLAKEYTGQGLMTASVKEMIAIGREFYSLNRIEIRCATENTKSRAIPERLGFTREGIARAAEYVNRQFLDHQVYSLLKAD